MIKKIFIGLIIVIAALQFIPKKLDNRDGSKTANAIDAIYPVPEPVMAILKNSCYDCHSNNTNYPWYASVQPLSMWISHHINEGKNELNFSAFGSYSIAKQLHKLHEISEQVEEKEMPLGSYTLIHTKAKLSEDQRQLLLHWSNELQDYFKKSYPEDSLKSKGKRS
jgi:hypothetical protein